MSELLEVIDKLRKVAVYQINIPKSVEFHIPSKSENVISRNLGSLFYSNYRSIKYTEINKNVI